jgi:hypothetical protein
MDGQEKSPVSKSFSQLVLHPFDISYKRSSGSDRDALAGMQFTVKWAVM